MKSLLVLFLVFNLYGMASGNSGEIALRLGSVVAAPGGTVQVPVELDNPSGAAIQASALTLVYDNRLVQAVDIDEYSSMGRQWWSLCDIGSVDDTTDFVHVDLAAAQPTTAKSGRFIVIDFSVAGTVSAGTIVPLQWVEGRVNPHLEQGNLAGASLRDGAIIVEEAGIGQDLTEELSFFKRKRRKRRNLIYIKPFWRRSGIVV